MHDIVSPIPDGSPTFAGRDACANVADLAAEIAILGVPHGMPYASAFASAHTPADGPSAIREHSTRFGRFFDNFDVDLGGPILAGLPIRIIDCGDVIGTPDDGEANHQRTEAAIRHIRSQGAVPIVLGGDDSIPIPVLRGIDDVPVTKLVQFDAHLDFRDEVEGIRDAWSSSIRRAAEMDHIGDIYQIGLRGVGSASVEDVREAQHRRHNFISAAEIDRHGVDRAADMLPSSGSAFITFDMDVMDPAIAQGVSSLAFGGLNYWQATGLLWRTATNCRIVGADFTEVNAGLDPRGLTPTLAARLILNLIGAMARSGQFAATA